ncbi:MAG: MFS transporter [Saprospiraceae bacterium]|nr:MFS transporter [Saprospiraceae bacterium]MBP7699840.1 MFS transporter [Saprospiraceae bacterium]
MEQRTNSTMYRSILNPAVIISALGYFVDIYDLLLFSIIRLKSLKSLGFSGEALIDNGIYLNNMQMFGMLLGGIIWGVLGDKKGRLSVLFGSIFLYSIANIANAFVSSIGAYAFWRFIAGIGLAGELGAGITLVAEKLPKEKRGIGTMIVAGIGLTGAIFAGFLAKIFDWRTCFMIGGVLGLLLLVLRIGVSESGIFKQSFKQDEIAIKHGDFLALFATRERMFRYLRSIFIGLPTWFVVGILVAYSPEFALRLGIVEDIKDVDPGTAIMFCYTGMAIGDILSGVFSQVLKNRKNVMAMFLIVNGIAITIYLSAKGVDIPTFYLFSGLLGFSVGFWVLYITMAAEQFGTNLRATVTTTVPNFIRGALVPISFTFKFLKDWTGDVISAAAIVGAFCWSVAIICLIGMKDTFTNDLDYNEL